MVYIDGKSVVSFNNVENLDLDRLALAIMEINGDDLDYSNLEMYHAIMNELETLARINLLADKQKYFKIGFEYYSFNNIVRISHSPSYLAVKYKDSLGSNDNLYLKEGSFDWKSFIAQTNLLPVFKESVYGRITATVTELEDEMAEMQKTINYLSPMGQQNIDLQNRIAELEEEKEKYKKALTLNKDLNELESDFPEEPDWAKELRRKRT